MSMFIVGMQGPVSRTRKARRGRQKKKPGLERKLRPGPAWCRWWDSNPHGFPNDFESFASAIPPHRPMGMFGCGPAPCRRPTAGAGPRNIAKPGASGAADPGPRPLHPAAPAYHVCYYSVSGVQNQAESFSFRKFGGGGGRAAQMGAPGGDFAPPGAGAGGALAAALMVSFLAGAGHLFSKKTLQMTRNFILYK